MCLSPILDPENSPKGTDIEGRRPRSPGSAQGQKNKTRRQHLWPLSSISSFGMLALVQNRQLRDVVAELAPQFLQRELSALPLGQDTRGPSAETPHARARASQVLQGRRRDAVVQYVQRELLERNVRARSVQKPDANIYL